MTQTWDEWKKTLAQAVGQGRAMGLSRDELVHRAEQIGDVLANSVDPTSPEQRVLKELWTSADEDEQKALASTIIKMVQR